MRRNKKKKLNQRNAANRMNRLRGDGSGAEPWRLVGVFLLWALIFRCRYLSIFLPSF